MAVITDPTSLDGQAQPPQVYEIEDLIRPSEVEQLSEAASTRPQGPEQTAQLQAQVVQLEAHTALRDATAPVPRLVRGRYRSTDAGHQLELRVDVDGLRPTMRVSGDFFQTSGATTSYVGSFVVEAPAITSEPGVVKLEGQGRFSFPVASRHVRVTIPRAAGLPPRPAMATVQFSAGAAAPGATATFVCSFVSPHFRSVQLEQDSVAGTVPFLSYDTGSLPQPPTSPSRTLTVPKAYQEAGVEVQMAGAPNIIDTSAAGPNAKWDEAELHNAMVNHFSLWRDAPLWQVWQLVATSHVDPLVRGIMFDFSGAFQRQGCAVFHDNIKGSDPASQRAQLRTYVHELGHAFNLLHSFEKNLGDPPQPLGPNGGFGDLSWMNYVQKFQPPPPAIGGPAAYWAAFPFQFTENELIHLRHGFFRDVVMGGKPFGRGAAEVDMDLFADPVIDNSGLALELRSDNTFRFGQPVVVELKLSTSDLRGRTTHGHLDPKDGFLSIAICDPSGETKLYRPPMRRCLDGDAEIRLDAERPAIYKSCYIGYGKEGQYFQQPGRYQLRAQYVSSDGSRVLSPIHQVTVRMPRTDDDENVAELMMGDEQGMLFYLLGSHSETLSSGNAALEEMIDRYSDHPLAVYPRLVKGANAARDFKYLSADKTLSTRAANPHESIEQLDSVIRASLEDRGVDNITLGWTMRRRARMEARAGDPERARRTMDQMVEVFRRRTSSPSVQRYIEMQAERVKEAVTRESR
ncbi:hypothetical protein FCH28_08160 [Streptomyces piniterrae]|uniref:Uncharacterized protein n=1 Tax=Streptomyces piniterrae TaxID=2571125 RepID=A0A4U0NS90_9ACTN|nr:hypothetical protein [Streptomyces piniterrae]TJZ57385.1 hypothetical protein FCH28_08160 [Streptomyces piniterrae]